MQSNLAHTITEEPAAKTISLESFMRKFAPQLEKKVDLLLKPLYNPQGEPDKFDSQITPYAIQREVVKAVTMAFKQENMKVVFITGEMGSGKCLSPETLVTINNELLTIAEAWGKYGELYKKTGTEQWNTPKSDITTPSLNEITGKIETRPIEYLYRQYIEEKIKTVELSDGSTLRPTLVHEFLTPSGWTNNINEGDYIAVPRHEPHTKGIPSIINPELCGWAIGEGHFHLSNKNTRNGYLSIAQKDETVLAKIEQLLATIPNHENSVKTKRTHNRCPEKYITSTEMVKLFETNGHKWGERCNNKTIPPFILNAPIEEIRVFLKSLFDADGTVAKGKTEASYCTASKLLANQTAFF